MDLVKSSPVIKIDTSFGNNWVQEFEVLKLVSEHSPILRKPAQKFDFNAFNKYVGGFSQLANPSYLANSMWETMLQNKGYGLAAPQCGIPWQVFVMGTDKVTKTVLFNPIIIMESPEIETSEEGCLTYKHLFVKVSRSKVVRVQFQDIQGKTQTQDYVGLTARVVQHEIDHLRGKLFWEKAGKVSLELARKRRKKLLKKEN